MIKSLLLFLIISSSYLMGQSHIKNIPNDSLTIWKHLTEIWGVDTSRTYAPIIIKGISNHYEFPGWVPDKKIRHRSNINLDKRVVNLTSGIYTASIMRSHSERYLLICSGDSISLIPDYMDVPGILAAFIRFCKSENYNDKQVIEYLNEVVEFIKMRRDSDKDL